MKSKLIQAALLQFTHPAKPYAFAKAGARDLQNSSRFHESIVDATQVIEDVADEIIEKTNPVLLAKAS